MTTASDSVLPKPAPAPPPGKRRRRVRWALLLALVLLALFVFRAPLLRMAAGCLVREDPEQPTDAVLLLGGNDCTHEAARQYRAGLTRAVLLIESRPDRLVRSGVLPSDVVRRTGQLANDGVPGNAVQVVHSEATSHWEAAAALRAWMEEHPEQRLGILCEQFESRKLGYIYDGTLGRDLAARVAWYPVHDRRFDETNWWQGRSGAQSFFRDAAGLAHVLVHGEDRDLPPPLDADAYERAVCPNLP